MNIEKKLLKHCQEYGINGLLPQNLTDSLLDRLLEEIMSIRDKDKKVAPTLLMLIILSLRSGHCLTNTPSMSIRFDGEKDLMDSFENYEMATMIEVYRRDSKIKISKDSLPTVKNIFNKNRNVTFTEVNI